MKTNGVPRHLDKPSQAQIGGCGMWVFILSLSILFVASIFAYLWIRYGPAPLPGPADSPLPSRGLDNLPLTGLLVSTVILLVSSVTLHLALLGAKKDNQGQVRGAMLATLLLGLAFLGNQVHNWVQLREMGLLFSNNTYKFGFVLTLLHALHIVGGVGPMAAVTAAAFRGVYTSASNTGLRWLSLYWHFLDVVWLVLLSLLLGTA